MARKLSCLRGFYKWLLLDKQIGHDPTVNLESPSSWKVLPKALAQSEVERMMDQAGMAANHPQADTVALRDRAIVETLSAGGIRISELTGLGVEDLSLARRAHVLIAAAKGVGAHCSIGASCGRSFAILSGLSGGLRWRLGRARADSSSPFAAPDSPGNGCGAW